MSRHVSVLVLAIAAFATATQPSRVDAQAPSITPAGDTVFPQRSALGEIWRTVLMQYRTGKMTTEADLIRETTDQVGGTIGKWRKGRPPKGGPPRVLDLNISQTAIIDSAWALQLVEDSLLDAYCSERELKYCDGEYVTLFLNLSPPVAGANGEVKVRVTERALSPSSCVNKPGTFTGMMEKMFRLRAKDSIWTVLGHEMVSGGSGFCEGG